MLKLRSLGVCAVLCSALATGGAAQAKSQKPIKLKLSSTYTVVALSKSGDMTSVKGKGSLKLVPPASKGTLHLIKSDGEYYGPIVVGKRGKSKVVVGVKAGANLGKVKVGSGYGKASVKKSKTVKSMTAKAKSGAPIGAKKVGLVRAKATRKTGDGVDQDRDGIPGAFDVDDDGDLTIDNFESQSNVRAQAVEEGTPEEVPSDPAEEQPEGTLPEGIDSPATGEPTDGDQAPEQPADSTESVNAPVDPNAAIESPGTAPSAGAVSPSQGTGGSGNNFSVFSNFKLGIEDTLNANSGVSDALINQLMASTQSLAIAVPSGNQALLNCNGLSYCSLGGTGQVGGTAFPDPANNVGGLGVMAVGPTGDMQLLTGANSGQIGSGDTLTAEVTTAGVTTYMPAMLNFVFVTTPALTSWSDGTNSGSISYPATGGPGTPSNPIPVTPNAGGQGEVTLTFWRPQRRGILAAGESLMMDIGNLTYTADIPNGPVGSGANGPGNCSVSSYSTSDPNLVVGTDGVDDQAGDQAANSANTLSFTVNLSNCLTAGGLTWSSGQTLGVDIQARSSGGDNAAQKIYFTLQ